MARSGANLSRTEAAKHLGVTDHTLSNYENGKTQIPLATALRLCDIYRVSIAELAGDPTFQSAVIDLRRATQQLERVEDYLERLERRGTTPQNGP